jgi:hypothetical protein
LAPAQARFQVANSDYSLAQSAVARAQAQAGNPTGRWIVYAGVAGALVVGDALFILYLYTDRQRDLENKAIVQGIAESSAQLNAEAADVGGLWMANQRQLAGYHQLVINYAAASRATTKFSLWFGFAFVALLGVVVIFTHSLAVTVASSVIATVGATLTGFVARAILRNSEASSREVLEFFSHPLETQRLLTARLLIESMPEDSQGPAKLILIQELMRARESGQPSGKD